MSSYSYIPSEILEEILLRLPVTSLLRFRCVSKSWCFLISLPAFISMHTSIATKIKKKSQFLMEIIYNDEKRSLKTEFMLYDENDGLFVKSKKIDSPLMTDFNFQKYEVVDSCNGLICLEDLLSGNFVMWNPILRKHVALPFSSVAKIEKNYSRAVGFWFDDKTGDYKLVQIVHPQDNLQSLVELYELKRNTWREICSFPQLSMKRSSTFFNGALHWLGYHEKDDPFEDVDYVRVVFFDTTNEVFRELELPEAAGGVGYKSVLIVHGRLLSLVADCETGFSIWVMKEYAVPESWIKVQFTNNLHGYEEVLKFRENDKLLLLQSRQLVWYDLRTGKRKLAIYFPRSVLFWGDNYVETLTLLDGFQGSDNYKQSVFTTQMRSLVNN